MGLESGKTILKKMVMSEAPSILADSSRLTGRLVMKFLVMIRL